MTRFSLRAVARFLVGVLLMAQMAIAAYACPTLLPAMAGNMQSGDASIADKSAPLPNCDDMAGALDPSSPNLCAEHCKAGQQSDRVPTLNLPAAVLSALYATALVPVAAPLPRAVAATMGASGAAPLPHTILHCVFRI